MRVRRLKLGLVATFMLTLWLVASFLGQESSQDDLRKKASTLSSTCHCRRKSSRKCACSSEIYECVPCLHTPGESDWFDERFEKAMEPLQRSEESMSSDALILWLVVGVWDKPLNSSLICSYELQGIQSEEFENQKQQPIKTSPKHPVGRVGPRCRTCAVVGNSRFLRGSGLGFRINQHDIVLRMNQAPVQGFEKDVGNTTTIRIMYPEIASTQDPGTQLLLLPLNSSGLKWFMKVLQEQNVIWKPKNPGYRMVQFPGGSTESKDEVFVISLTFLQYVQDHWLRKQDQFPSLGFVALLYALHTCDQVSLFGFGTDQLMRWSHYWDDKYRFKSKTHSFEDEQQIILKLQCEGKVVIYS
ncbi:CMP-N-acetylneuraminate-beta-galactosamide-alpha-2,3-sialyltransferase 1-like isoform X1 [Equus przewalskii]|nr:CMP-N-acetylneuraminate-beta-galactosamide-alpha-2,3-sialyltransferase 1 isoform X1 [Equus caballus]XP_023481705.1 CMP-N-acetylneuraminate-beta-galactosamide-alpha-2,3-sialyltransferase 1 isoform X1 [Equus caballus]